MAKHDYTAANISNISSEITAMKNVTNSELSIESMPFAWNAGIIRGVVQWAEIKMLIHEKDKLAEFFQQANNKLSEKSEKIESFDNNVSSQIDSILNNLKQINSSIFTLTNQAVEYGIVQENKEWVRSDYGKVNNVETKKVTNGIYNINSINVNKYRFRLSDGKEVEMSPKLFLILSITKNNFFDIDTEKIYKLINDGEIEINNGRIDIVNMPDYRVYVECENNIFVKEIEELKEKLFKIDSNNLLKNAKWEMDRNGNLRCVLNQKISSNTEIKFSASINLITGMIQGKYTMETKDSEEKSTHSISIVMEKEIVKSVVPVFISEKSEATLPNVSKAIWEQAYCFVNGLWKKGVIFSMNVSGVLNEIAKFTGKSLDIIKETCYDLIVNLENSIDSKDYAQMAFCIAAIVAMCLIPVGV